VKSAGEIGLTAKETKDLLLKRNVKTKGSESFQIIDFI